MICLDKDKRLVILSLIFQRVITKNGEAQKMPVYEYQCTACGQVQETFQKISAPPLEICSQCKGHLKKLISQSSFHLKGSGWYVTDYGGSKAGAESRGKLAETSAEKPAEKPIEKTCGSDS